MRKFAKHGCSEIGRLQRSESCEPVVGRRQARAYCEIGYEKQMEQWAERNNKYKVVCGCAANRVVHVVPYNENYKRKNVSAQVASLAYFRAMRRKILLRKLKHIAQIRHNEKQIGYRLQDFVDWIFDVCVCVFLYFSSIRSAHLRHHFLF